MYFLEKNESRQEEQQKEYEEYYQNYLKQAKEEAEKLNLDALMFLGFHYTNKRNPDYDPVEGYHYFLRAYTNDSKEAAMFLGKLYANGEGVSKDIDKAIDFYQEIIRNVKNVSPSAYSALIHIYLTEENYLDLDKAGRYLKELILDSLSHSEDYEKANPVTSDQYPEQSEFCYHFDENQRVMERYRILKEAFEKIENDDSTALVELDEDFLKESALGNMVLSYCFATGKIVEKDIFQAQLYFALGYQKNEYAAMKQLWKMDITAYLPYTPPSANDQLINPYGYIFNQEDMDDYVKEQKKMAKYNIPSAVMFLAYGCLGRFKYFPIDYDQAMDYLSQAKSLGIPDACIHIARMYHDGLGNPVDKERATSLLEEVKGKNDDALLYLALYAIQDEGSIEKANCYLMEYSNKELKADLALCQEYLNHKDEVKDEKTQEYLNQNLEGANFDKDGLEAFENKDYAKAIELFEQSAQKDEMTEGAIHMAIMHLNGYGVTQDIELACQLIQEVLDIDMM